MEEWESGLRLIKTLGEGPNSAYHTLLVEASQDLLILKVVQLEHFPEGLNFSKDGKSLPLCGEWITP